MKKIIDYINENLEQNINESVLLTCLLGACALHFGIKLTRKVGKTCGEFWDWMLGDKDLSFQNASESLNEDKKEKFDKSKVQPMQIPSFDILEKVIAMSNPKDGKNKSGFYYIDNLLKEISELKNIDKAPYYPSYVAFLHESSEKDKSKKPNIYGLLGFSLKYWKVQAKNGKTDELKDFAKSHSKYINIFAVQTDPEFAKLGLFDVYVENMKKACNEAKMEGITIQCEDENLASVYKKYGFKECENNKSYMEITL